MPKPPKKCMKCSKWAIPDSIYCSSHGATDRLPRPQRTERGPRGQRGRNRVTDKGKITAGKITAGDIKLSSIDAGHIAIGMIDMKTGRRWTEHKYSDEWLARYGRTHG